MFVNCPHCLLTVEIIEMNCKIFRCGVFKKDYQQINPHADKQTCEYYVKNNMIWGCGKPFKFDDKSGIVACGYI